MGKLWTHVFENELQIDPKESSIFMTERPLTTKADREKQIQLFFEEYNFQAAYLGNSQLMALYGSGRTTGCIVDIGAGIGNVVPVYEGYSLPHAVTKLELGGDKLADFLIKRVG